VSEIYHVAWTTDYPLRHGVLRLLELIQPGGRCAVVVLQLQSLLRLPHRVLQQALRITAPLQTQSRKQHMLNHRPTLTPDFGLTLSS